MLGFRRAIRPHLHSAWRLTMLGLLGMFAALSGLRLPVHTSHLVRVALQAIVVVLVLLALRAFRQAPRMGGTRYLRFARGQVLFSLALVAQALVLLLRPTE
jgi:hypothetical protein